MSAGTKSDKANRLTPVESYQYDVTGRRIATIRGTNTVRHLYEGLHVVADTDADGNLLRSYTWGPGIDNLLAMTVYDAATNIYPAATSGTYQAITDHLGTVHALVTSGGTVAERYEYDAWGNVLGVFDGNGGSLPTSALGNRYLFQGREYSWAVHAAWDGAGLYYFRARWYDPSTGRWLSNDPIGIGGGLNQYVAFGNNPVMFVDPLGLLTFDDLKIMPKSYRDQIKQALSDTSKNFRDNPRDARERGGVVYRGTTKDRYRATKTFVSPPPGPNQWTGFGYGWPDGFPIPEFNMWTDNYFAWGHWGAQHYDIWFIWHTHPPIDDGTQPPSNVDLIPGSHDQVVISEKCVYIVDKSGKVTERMPTDEFFQ